MGTRNKVFQLVAVALVSAAAALSLVACGGDREDGAAEPRPIDPAEIESLIASSPPALAELYRREGELIDAGHEGFEQALSDLEGHPVVVNVWASWCGPCRAEFPHFRDVALEHGSRVAFLGLDSDDNEDAALTFLSDNQVPYPSYTDPDMSIATDLGATFGLPATVYFDRAGDRAYIHHGGYASKEDLVAHVERYALGR